MSFERNPNIPPPPPPSGSRKPEAQRSPELNEVEQILFKNSAEYGNLTPQEAAMTPKLRQILENFRKDRLFAVQVYVSRGTSALDNDGHGFYPTYDGPDLKKLGIGMLYGDIGDRNQDSMNYKMEEHVAEAVAFIPVETRDSKQVEKVVRPGSFFRKEVKQTVTEYGPQRPVRFKEAVPKSSQAIAQEPLVRMTYHASDPKLSRDGYNLHTTADVSWRKAQDNNVNNVAVPVPLSPDPAQNIDVHMNDILHMRKLSVEKLQNGRPGGQLAFAIMLPESRARELWNYFQQNPEHVRPFFIAGAEDLMPLHMPPPYKKWDSELPQKPVLFREFDGAKKEVAKVIKNSK